MKIKSIKKVKPRTVYAIQTTTNTFIADNLAHHNCAGCNTYNAGNGPEFTLRLIEEHGIDVVNEMKERRHTEPPLTNKQLQEIINKYSEK